MCQAMKTASKLVVTSSVALALAWVPLARAGDLNTEMQQMFNDIGAMSSTTGPSAYKGQSMNLYMGGDMQVRTPIRNYQLFNFAMPNVKASCGGVDAFLGSFSFIDTAQFKQMLQQLANNTVGLLFQAALASIQPLIASKLEWLQKIIQDANISNVNTCNMAKQIVGGAAGALGVSAYDNCMSVANFFGWDQEDAKRACKNDPVTPRKSAVASGDPIYSKIGQRTINLMWAALDKTSFTSQEKETFINIAGTTIIYETDVAGSTPTPKVINPMDDGAWRLLAGNAPGSTADKVKIDWWMCDGSPGCTAMIQTKVEVVPFTTLVENLLASIDGKMRSSTPLGNAEIGFINTTQLPVYRMLTIGYSAPDNTLSELLIRKYRIVIAYDYAFTFLQRALKEARFYVGLLDTRDAREDERLKDLLDGVERKVDHLFHERTNALASVRDMNGFAEDLQALERSLTTTIPFRLKSTLDFSASLARVGR